MSQETMNFIYQMLPLVVLLLVAYLFMIRPQQKRQKEQQELIRGLKKGDKVQTIGGIQGTVKSVDSQYVVLIINSKGTEMTFDKLAIKPGKK